MDAREQLRRYLEQRRDLGESELVLDSMSVDDALARPAAVAPVPLGGQLAGGVDTELAAVELLVRRMIEMIDRADRMNSLDFAANVDGSLLPEFIQLADRAHIRLAFIRVQRRPSPEGPPPQSDALKRYVAELRHYLETRGAYFYDDWGDADEPLSEYADGDHLTGDARIRYTERFAAKHARFLQ